ncbi:MAG: hypothetical protein J0H54_01925, partial [Rhizobiales bacterium]|nr:hypothetical protein [Hyphomicrobiales bacterium]
MPNVRSAPFPRTLRSAAPAGAGGDDRSGAVASARAVLLAGLLVLVSAPAALAQEPPLPPADIPDGTAAEEPMSLAPVLPETTDPSTLLRPGVGDGQAAAKTASASGLTLSARLTDKGETIGAGLVWRVFSPDAGTDGKLPLLQEAKGGTVHFDLKPGRYIVHVAYGKAGLVKAIQVGTRGNSQDVVLNAGAMQLSALVGKDRALAAGQVKFDIYPGTDGADAETDPIATDVAPDQTVRLAAGTYHVVSRYGDANASVRADIRVEAGKLTDATMFQKAGRITLKLVDAAGGEALANTSWSVVTPGGDSVFDSVGAFQEVVLAIGDYTAVAKHDDQIVEKN